MRKWCYGLTALAAALASGEEPPPAPKEFRIVENALVITEIKNEPFKIRYRGKTPPDKDKKSAVSFLNNDPFKGLAVGDTIDGFKVLAYREKKDEKDRDISELDIQREGDPVVTLITNQDVLAGYETVAFIKNSSLPNPTHASTAYMYRKGLKIIVATDIEKPDKTMGKLNVELEITKIDFDSGVVLLEETAPLHQRHEIKWEKPKQ